MGLRLSRSAAANPVHRLELRPAAPPRLRHDGVPRPRNRRHAGPRRDARRAFLGADPRSRLGMVLPAGRRPRRVDDGSHQRPAVPYHSPLPHADLRGAGRAAQRRRGHAMMALVAQLLHMALVLALAPALTGLVRKTKARLLGRRGPAIEQPYRDLARLLRKDAVLADNASWLFRTTPYLVFTAIWLAASLVPTLTTDLLLSPTADLIALVALLGSARFFTALAGMDVGTSFGGIGASREMMIASLAEPAMLMVIFTVSLLIGSTSLATISKFVIVNSLGLRISLGLGLVAFTL